MKKRPREAEAPAGEDRQAQPGRHDETTTPENSAARKGLPRCCGGITLQCGQVEAAVDLEALFEVYPLVMLDPGGNAAIVVCRGDDVIFRRFVTERTAGRVREIVKKGPRLPMGLHWRWLHGSPALEELMSRIAA